MNRADRHLRDLFVDAVGSPVADDRGSGARTALREAIAGESAASRRRRPAWPVAIGVAALIGFLVAAAVLLTPPDSEATEIEELARAAEVVAPVDLPAGAYVYVESERAALAFGNITTPGSEGLVIYLLPSRVQQWWQGGALLERVTVGDPEFFDPDSRERYLGSELPVVDGVGQTTETGLVDVGVSTDPSEWSSDPDVLAAQIEAASVRRDDDPRPSAVVRLELVQELLSPELLAPPQLRANLIRYLDTLDGREIRSDRSTLSVALTYDDPGRGTTTKVLTFDRDGYLVAVEETIVESDVAEVPDGTTVFRLSQSVPRIAEEPGVVP